MKKNNFQHVLGILTFAAIYYLFEYAQFEPPLLASLLSKPEFTSVQLTSGDLYGICAPIEHLRDLNREISPLLTRLTLTPFFRTYRVNIERECPFWAQQRICNNQKCTVCECTDDEIPEFWRHQKQISQPTNFSHSILQTTQAVKKPLTQDCPKSLQEWCIDDVEDNLASDEFIFVNLADNRESYTAYQGAPVWKAIYEENCNWQKSPLDTDVCTEETFLYQLMSGLHTSINTHVSDGFEDRQGKSVHNLEYFNERIGNHEERIKNLHLIFAVAVKATALVGESLLTLDYSSNGLEQAETKQNLKDILKKIKQECDEPFKERNLFQFSEVIPQEQQLEHLKTLQHKFYNISRIMDCVICDKCRLNGKVQVRGLATALKVLFMPDDLKIKVIQQLKIGEIVSLIQVFSKLSESLLILDKFKALEDQGHLDYQSRRKQVSVVLGLLGAFLIWKQVGNQKRKEQQKKVCEE